MIEAFLSLVMMGQAEFSCLAQNIYYESRNQPFKGQLAVAEVTLNRVEDPRWPDSVCAVVKQPYQFSWVGNEKGIHEKDAWQRAKFVAIVAMAMPKREDITHFHATYVKPSWAKKKKVKAKIGDHIFYS